MFFNLLFLFSVSTIVSSLLILQCGCCKGKKKEQSSVKGMTTMKDGVVDAHDPAYQTMFGLMKFPKRRTRRGRRDRHAGSEDNAGGSVGRGQVAAAKGERLRARRQQMPSSLGPKGRAEDREGRNKTKKRKKTGQQQPEPIWEEEKQLGRVHQRARSRGQHKQREEQPRNLNFVAADEPDYSALANLKEQPFTRGQQEQQPTADGTDEYAQLVGE